MKTGIVTFHFVNNFGAALQTYGLMRAIEKETDSKAEVVDYRHWFIRFTDTVRLFPITTNVKEIISGLCTMSQRFGRIRKFSKFHEDLFHMSERYNFPGQLRKSQNKCDKYVCGSDQVWNPVVTLGVAEPYYLGFEKKSENKFSYAPSFGVSSINPKYRNRMESYISEIGTLSVRESDGVNIVKDLTGKDAVQLIDPTFLVDKKEWSSIAVKPKVQGKYILLYIMQRNEEVYEYARKLKEKLGLPIVEISRYGYKPDFIDETIIDVGPREWLGLVENAAFVCTNSFHGMAFSIIFEKNFFLVPSKKFNSRMSSLMDVFKIEGTYDIEKTDLTTERYSRDAVRSIIASEQKKSFEYLRKCINTSGGYND